MLPCHWGPWVVSQMLERCKYGPNIPGDPEQPAGGIALGVGEWMGLLEGDKF